MSKSTDILMTGHNKGTSEVSSRSSFVTNGISNRRGGAEVLESDDSRGSGLGNSFTKTKNTGKLSSTNPNSYSFGSEISTCSL